MGVCTPWEINLLVHERSNVGQLHGVSSGVDNYTALTWPVYPAKIEYEKVCMS